MRKILIPILILLISVAVQARAVNLNEENIANGTITQNGSIYKILYVVQTYLFDGTSFTRYIIEDLIKINELEDVIETAPDEIKKIDAELQELESKKTELGDEMEEKKESIDFLQKQKIYYSNWLGNLTTEEGSLENQITSNLLVSPNSYRAGIVIIVILIILVVVFRGSEVFEVRKKGNKGQATINQVEETKNTEAN